MFNFRKLIVLIISVSISSSAFAQVLDVRESVRALNESPAAYFAGGASSYATAVLGGQATQYILASAVSVAPAAAICAPAVGVLHLLTACDSIERLAALYTGHEPVIAKYNPTAHIASFLNKGLDASWFLKKVEDSTWNRAFEQGQRDFSVLATVTNGVFSIWKLMGIWKNLAPKQYSAEQSDLLRSLRLRIVTNNLSSGDLEDAVADLLTIQPEFREKVLDNLRFDYPYIWLSHAMRDAHTKVLARSIPHWNQEVAVQKLTKIRGFTEREHFAKLVRSLKVSSDRNDQFESITEMLLEFSADRRADVVKSVLDEIEAYRAGNPQARISDFDILFMLRGNLNHSINIAGYYEKREHQEAEFEREHKPLLTLLDVALERSYLTVVLSELTEMPNHLKSELAGNTLLFNRFAHQQLERFKVKLQIWARSGKTEDGIRDLLGFTRNIIAVCGHARYKDEQETETLIQPSLALSFGIELLAVLRPELGDQLDIQNPEQIPEQYREVVGPIFRDMLELQRSYLSTF